MKFLFYVALGGVAAFYIAKWAGYTTFAQVEHDIRGAGKSISRTADDVGDTAGDAANTVNKEVK